MSKPGGGAPLRSENGDAISVVRVHPDIRNNREQLNEEAKKKTVVNGNGKLSCEGLLNSALANFFECHITI